MEVSAASLAYPMIPSRGRSTVPVANLLPHSSNARDEQPESAALKIDTLFPYKSSEEVAQNQHKATSTYDQPIFEQIGRRDLAIRLDEQARQVEGVRHSAHVNFELRSGTTSEILTIDLESGVEIAAVYDLVQSAPHDDNASRLTFAQPQQFNVLASQSPFSNDSLDAKIFHQEYGSVEKKSNPISLIPNNKRNADAQATLNPEVGSVRRAREAEIKADYIDKEVPKNSSSPLISSEPSIPTFEMQKEEHETARQAFERIILAFKPQNQKTGFSGYISLEKSIDKLGLLDVHV